MTPYDFIGYAPDIDPTTPGVIVDCNQIVPSFRGFESAPRNEDVGITALPAACRGSAVLLKPDETTRFFAGTSGKLYEEASGLWTEVTRSAGGDYTLASDAKWVFSQFGSVSLAAQRGDILQASVTSGKYADIAGAPKAAIVETVNNFVFAFDTDGSAFGDSPNRWHCSALGDHTDWTPSIATQCASGTLTSSPGRILAGKRFGNNIVAHKQRAMYLGVYVGPPVIWDFQELPGQVGALGQGAVVDIGTPEAPIHLFMGYNDFYRFDGARASPIPNGLKETVFRELNRDLSHLSRVLHDRDNGRVYFFYCTSSSIRPDKCVVYNYRTNKWGRDDQTIEDVIEFIAGSLTYAGLGSLFSTYASLPSSSYSDAFFSAGTPAPAVFNTSHKVDTLSGTPTTSSLTTGDMGSEESFSLLNRVIAKWLSKPSSCNMVNFYRPNSLGDNLSMGSTTPMDSRSRFDVQAEAKWHRLRFDFVGTTELPAIAVDLQQSSDE